MAFLLAFDQIDRDVASEGSEIMKYLEANQGTIKLSLSADEMEIPKHPQSFSSQKNEFF